MVSAMDIVKGVCDALNECFDITIYTEQVEQGLKLPCFFVYCAKLSRERYRGKRYLAKNEICIQYIPSDSTRMNDEISETLEKLYLCTEYIKADNGGEKIMLYGSKPRVEKGDGYTEFYINYDMFYLIEDDTALMEELTVINERSNKYEKRR